MENNFENLYKQALDVLEETQVNQSYFALKNPLIRFILWELFLNTIQPDLPYEEQQQLLQEEFNKLKEKHLPKTYKHPLRNDAIDKIKKQVSKDVPRTYQELQLFQEPSTQQILTNILVIWASENSECSYKQGMNEIVGVLFQVYHSCFKQYQYAESSIYFVFNKILVDANHQLIFKVFEKNCNQAPIITQIHKINNEYLKKLDLELFKLINQTDIHIEAFMIRWIKCLLSREFEIEEIMIIWDHLFMEFYWKKSFLQLFYSIQLSMFFQIKELCMSKHDLSQKYRAKITSMTL